MVSSFVLVESIRLPIDQPHKWYIAQGFGEKTSYGYHEGDDYNLKTGGNSDLGQPIFAIADGVVTSVHSHTTKPTFGIHVHIKHDGPWGTVWCHFAHCQKIFVKEGDRVKKGQIIAFLGNSGTDSPHLHWTIKLQPTGIDGIAKTKEDLAKWTNPTEFVEKWKTQPAPAPQPPMPEKTCEQMRDRNWNFGVGLLKELGIEGVDDSNCDEKFRLGTETIQQIKKNSEEKDSLLRQIDSHKETLSTNLVATDNTWESIVAASETFSKLFDKAQDADRKYQKEMQAHQKSVDDAAIKFDELKNRIDKIEKNHQQEIDDMKLEHKNELDRIRQQITDAVKDYQDHKDEFQRYMKARNFIKDIFSKLLERIKKGKK